jgi:hypothetical protein
LKLGGDLSAEVYRVLNRPEPIEESGDAEHTEPEASQ